MSNMEKNIKISGGLIETIKSNSKYYKSGYGKIILTKKNDEFQIFSGIFSLTNQKIEEEKVDFEDLIYIQKRFTIEEIINIIRNITNQKIIKINDYSLKIEGYFSEIQFLPSKKRYGYIKNDWPIKHTNFRISNTHNLPSGPLISKDFKVFPDARKAIVTLLELSSTNPDTAIWFQIPDYRARIVDLEISENELIIEVERLHMDKKSIGIKFYWDYQESSQYLGDEIFYSDQSELLTLDKNNKVSIEILDDYSYILAIIIDKKTGNMIDYREYYTSWVQNDGVSIKDKNVDVNELLRKGENEHIEFKQKLDDEFLESVIAFANSLGGYILLGVADDSLVIGFELKNENQIVNLITSNIEPEPIINEVKYEIDGKPLLLINIDEGNNKPYSHKQKGVYIRSGSTDRRATRSDLDEIYESKKGNNISFR
jgi:hypothetical protein